MRSALARSALAGVHDLARFDWSVRLLLLNQLAINTGYYMLYPYLAVHMTAQLGLGASVVGLVLGAGNLSQQGLFLVGGTLADRLGAKRVIVAGCAVRSLGFFLYLVSSDLPGLLAGAVLSGFAGALFNPAVRAYLATAAEGDTVEAFALFNVFANGGLVLGPVVGLVLFQLGFGPVSGVAAALFLALAVAQALFLPARTVAGGGPAPPLSEALGSRRLLLFAAPMAGYFALYMQFYLALPLAMRAATGSDGAAGLIFVVSAVLAIAGQVPVVAFAKRRWAPRRSVLIGLGIMTVSFLPVLLATPFLPFRFGDARAGAVAGAAPVLLATAALTLGTMVAQPFAMGIVTSLGGRLVGTAFGVYYLALGIGGALGNLVAGAAFDAGGRAGAPWLPWLVLVGVGALTTAATAAGTHDSAPRSPSGPS